MSTVKKQETKKAKIKLVTKDMPIAVALMILIGDKELRKTRIAPEYKERLYLILEPLESELNHLTEDIFRNNNIHLKDDDEIYKRIYENRGHLNFANLIEYLRAFYEDDMTISHINGKHDVFPRFLLGNSSYFPEWVFCTIQFKGRICKIYKKL